MEGKIRSVGRFGAWENQLCGNGVPTRLRLFSQNCVTEITAERRRKISKSWARARLAFNFHQRKRQTQAWHKPGVASNAAANWLELWVTPSTHIFPGLPLAAVAERGRVYWPQVSSRICGGGH